MSTGGVDSNSSLILCQASVCHSEEAVGVAGPLGILSILIPFSGFWGFPTKAGMYV